MRTQDDSTDAPLVRAQAEAAAWISVLHSCERDAEIEAGLRRWISADPLHAQVWEVASDIWNETSSLPRRIPPSRAIPSRSRRVYLRPALALATLFLVVAAGLTLHQLHSSVSTTVGEQRVLNLEDGTRVELNTESQLTIQYTRHARTVVLDSGEAYFQVAREQRPFVVVAGERKILALGTAFTVRRDNAADDPVTVTLIEGRVAVAPLETPASGSSNSTADISEVKVLNPGDRLRVHKHARPTLETTSIDKATGWMRGQLIFDHTPLREAAAELSRYSKIKITVASPEAAKIPIGGIFRIGDSRSFARAVAASYGLSITVHADELILEPAQSVSP
jgi:transmembrane sensor